MDVEDVVCCAGHAERGVVWWGENAVAEEGADVGHADEGGGGRGEEDDGVLGFALRMDPQVVL